jgi:hypothetical protein
MTSNKGSPTMYGKFDTHCKPKFDNSIPISIKFNIQIYIYIPKKLDENHILNSKNMKKNSNKPTQ